MSGLVVAALAGAGGSVRAGPRDVIINEILYNVFQSGEEDRREFIELYNGGGTPVHLEGWYFSRGLEFTFEEDFVLAPKSFVVVSANPDFAVERMGVPREQVVGPFAGRLENDGEILELVDVDGRYVTHVHFEDGGSWPGRPDGRGPSAEFVGVDHGDDLPRHWKPSLVLGGTPGSVNSRRETEEPVVEAPPGVVIVAEQGIWRSFPGRSSPSEPLDAWTEPDFDDADWPSGPGGFGFGDGHGFAVSTRLDDMRFEYSTLFLRGGFELDAEMFQAAREGGRLVLAVSFDDGFVAYLNGEEVARRNLGTEGEPVAANARAATTTSASVEIDVTSFAQVVRQGANVLALVGANRRVSNGDFFLGAELRLVTAAEKPEEAEALPYVGGVINELLPDPSDDERGFIELHNPTDRPLDLGGHFLLSSFGNFVHEIGAPLVIDPGAFALLDSRNLAERIPSDDQRFILLGSDGRTIIDDVELGLSDGRSSGRFPDGAGAVKVLDAPSPGEPNDYVYSTPVVINEINFHPAFVPASEGCVRDCSDVDQWIELHNRTDEEVDLGGWALARGVRFLFPAGVTIPPRGFLVVSASLEAFASRHPGVENVVGEWGGWLSHASESIQLLDVLGNRVDRVIYGDGKPVNDENPIDGVNDRTFRATPWPFGADGDGPTLELIHPDLGNRSGLAWRVSEAAGGTPGTVNSTFDADASPTIRDVECSPVVPRAEEPVRVTCRITALKEIALVVVRWAVDGGGGSGNAELNDEGSGEDEIAGDGIFTATLPPQADGVVVRFFIEVEDSIGSSSRLPVEPEVAPYGGFPGTFFLYEVDDTPDPRVGSPVYRVVMTRSDTERLEDRNLNSNVLLPATFIAQGKAHHVVGVRYRGENSRRENNRGYKLRFASERDFAGVTNINLNAGNGRGFGVSGFAEVLAGDLFRRAGAPYPRIYPVALHFAGEVARDFDFRYVHKEAYNEDFLDRAFGSGDRGNLYRARNPGGPGRPSGDLSFRGEDVDAYRPLYVKGSNEDEDDYGDVIELVRLFDPEQTSDEEFVTGAEQLLDVRQWAGFFAITACMTNTDGGIWNNNGEDYFLYHMADDSPLPNAGKWLLLTWDLEETFVASDERLFRSTVPAIVRFLGQPRFARLYYEELFRLRDGPFSRAEMTQRYGAAESMFQVSDVYDVVDEIETMITQRLGYLDEVVVRSIEGGAREAADPVGEFIVGPGAEWRFFRGTTSPPANWYSPDFDDSEWEVGRAGFGYGDGDDETFLDDMQDLYATVFKRQTFEVKSPGEVGRLSLLMNYDDAFVAYINGVEVLRSAAAPDGVIDADSRAVDSHEANRGEQDGFERFDVPLENAALVAGTNMIAVVGLNRAVDSSDFTLHAALAVSRSFDGGGQAGGCGTEIFIEGGGLVLQGMANPVSTEMVMVAGSPVEPQLVVGGEGPYGAVWSAAVDGMVVGQQTIRVATIDLEGEESDSEEFVVERVPGSIGSLGGRVDVDTTWTRGEGPYRLVSDVIVSEGATLTIGPGVTIIANARASIIVEGRLSALGSQESPIVFRSWVCDRPWGGIAFARTGTSDDSPLHLLAHCDIRGASAPGGYEGAVAPVESRLRIEDCVLASLVENAVDGSDSRVEIVRTRFEDIFEGVHCTDSSTDVLDCVFDRIKGNSDAIEFDGGGDARSRIERCVISGSSDDGVDLGDVSVDIRDNYFVDIDHDAISIEAPGAQGHPVITGNVIFRCGTGMAIKDGIDISDGAHNTIVGCRFGMNFFAQDDAPNGGHGSFESAIVWGNVQDVKIGARSGAVFTYSDIGGDEVFEGEGNILAEPMFLDPEAGDFSLVKGSPCVGTGFGGTDMGAIPFGGRPDPGEFIRGDVDLSGAVNLSDAVLTLDWLFRQAAGPACEDRADPNDDGEINLTDGVYILQFLFARGPAIAAPYPDPGTDPTADGLSCD